MRKVEKTLSAVVSAECLRIGWLFGGGTCNGSDEYRYRVSFYYFFSNISFLLIKYLISGSFLSFYCLLLGEILSDCELMRRC